MTIPMLQAIVVCGRSVGLMVLPSLGHCQICLLTFPAPAPVVHPPLFPGGLYSVLAFGGQVSVSLAIDCTKTWHLPSLDCLWNWRPRMCALEMLGGISKMAHGIMKRYEIYP